MDIIAQIMSDEVDFHKMSPHDELLTEHQVLRIYALAEPGQQHLVFTPEGEPFALRLEEGTYGSNTWADAKTGEKVLHPKGVAAVKIL